MGTKSGARCWTNREVFHPTGENWRRAEPRSFCAWKSAGDISPSSGLPALWSILIRDTGERANWQNAHILATLWMNRERKKKREKERKKGREREREKKNYITLEMLHVRQTNDKRTDETVSKRKRSRPEKGRKRRETPLLINVYLPPI